MTHRIDRYLAKRADLGRWPLAHGALDGIDLVVAIPVLAEGEYLFDTLASLRANRAEACRSTLVLCVVNNRAMPHAAASDIEDNRRTLARLDAVMQRDDRLRLAYVDASSPGLELPPEEGVGLARKIGLDWGLDVLRRNGGAGTLVCLDADTQVSPDYIDAIRRHFARPDAWAAVIAYAHRLDGPPTECAGILCYELYLRYHALGLAYAGSPYAFHTIGSAMACSAEAYAAVSGMNRRLAAEDFYFLQQLAKTGPVDSIDEATVYPSARTSARVPFGTGARMREFQSSAEDAYLVYDPKVYTVLKRWFETVSASPESSAESLLASAEAIHPELRAFLEASAFQRNWENLRKNSTGPNAFLAQFHRWFDSLKTLRCIHHLRAHGMPQQTLFCALDALLTMTKLHFARELPPPVIPAKAGIQSGNLDTRPKAWVPAFAGMTEGVACIADIGREDFEAQRRLLDSLRRIPMNKAGIRV